MSTDTMWHPHLLRVMRMVARVLESRGLDAYVEEEWRVVVCDVFVYGGVPHFSFTIHADTKGLLFAISGTWSVPSGSIGMSDAEALGHAVADDLQARLATRYANLLEAK